MASGKGNITKMLSEISEQPRVLAGFNSLNAGCLESLSDEMRAKSIKHVIFAARGTSYHAGLYGQYVLAVKCGMPASAALPSCVTLYESAPFTEDDLVIGVSQSGQAADVLEVLEKAKKCGALTAAITNDGSSPVAACAKYHIDCGAGEEVSVAATKTFTAQMSGVLLLAAHISGDKGITEAFERLPDKVKETEDMCVRDIDAYAERYINTKDGFIVSRGFMYPVALEAALKMQETCYVRMKGYSAADFMHGPIAQTDADTSVIVLAPSGRTFDD